MNLSLLLKKEQLGESSANRDARNLALPGLRYELGTSIAPRDLISKASQQPSAGPASFFLPTLAALTDRIQQQLASEPRKILQLNPTRREAICRHLEILSGLTLPASGSQDRLRCWLESGTCPEALTRYWREVALFGLAQAIVLKAWSDRGTRRWKKEDLQDLNASFHGALKGQLPLDREGWQFTRPNLYSWFRLSPELQDALWREFSHWKIIEEGPELLVSLLQNLQEPSASARTVYEEQIYRVLWKHSVETALEADSKRRRSAFSPTLRDGAVVRTGSRHLEWYGLEQDALSLFVSEFSLLWWGPTSPPFWTTGSGLEALSREQLSLGLGTTAKASQHQRLAEMEACDLAWVAEENILRGSGRSPAASAFREAVEQNPVLRKLRSGGTSLGHLQACVALSKLRPGGKMWWLREEPLHASDGSEALQFLLDRGKLLAEWDLSGLQIQFPTQPRSRPLPALYLWARETDLQLRHDHQPLRIRVKGAIRSHVELEPLLDDLLAALETGSAPANARLHWQLYVQQSPQTQRTWADRWPELLQEENLEKLDQIRKHSTPLAALATIRGMEPSSAKIPSIAASLSGAFRGFFVRQIQTPAGARLSCQPASSGTPDQAAFLVLLGDEGLSAPIRAFLESESTAFWLNQKAELRGNRWILREQDIKAIPIPKLLASGMASETPSGPLPGSWERLASSLSSQPQQVLKALASEHAKETHLEIFFRATRIRDELRGSLAKMSDWVSREGRILWTPLLQKCETCEWVPITLHPEVVIQAGAGGIPLQTALIRKNRSTAGQWSLTLSTETGASIALKFARRLTFEMISEQIEAMENPTWSEVVEFVRAPRKPEVLEQRASTVLRAHAEQLMLVAELDKIIALTLGRSLQITQD
jgi:hypothetical protein